MRKPVEIRRVEASGLKVTWSDGAAQEISATVLRRECPCATCKERRGDESHAAPLTPKKRTLTIVESSLAEEVRLEEIWAVGNYALGIRWGDGHDTGIYTYDYLSSLPAK